MIQIGGLEPCSFSDYPGKTAAVFFTQGCNFRCPFCHNPELLQSGRPGKIDEGDCLSFLRDRRGLLDGVVISGGEPCLQVDLPAFITRVRELGYPVKLDTNGSRPEILARLLEMKLLNYIAMDIKAPLSRYDQLCGVAVDISAIRASMTLIARSGVAHHFRTTLYHELLTRRDINQITGLVPPGSEHITQPYVSF